MTTAPIAFSRSSRSPLLLTLITALPTAKGNEPPEPNSTCFIAKAVEPDPATRRSASSRRNAAERAAAVVLIKEILAIGKYDPNYYADSIKLHTALWENVAEVVDTPADKVKCYEKRLDAAKEFEAFTRVRVAAGNDPPQSLNIAKAARIDAEIDLLKLKDSPKGGK